MEGLHYLLVSGTNREIENPRVGSSILSPGTIYSKKPVLKSTGFFYTCNSSCYTIGVH
jgi:hypothetical protein